MLEEIQLQQVLPQEIEKRSFEIITEELGNVELDPLQAPIIKRAIHTSADFDYLKNLTFSELAVEQFHKVSLSYCVTPSLKRLLAVQEYQPVVHHLRLSASA